MKQDQTSEAEEDRKELEILLAALLVAQAYRVSEKLAALMTALPGQITMTADELAAAAFELEIEINIMASAVRPFLGREAGRAITAMQMDYGVGGDVTVTSEFIRDLLQAQESRFARDISDTSVRHIRDQIAEGIANGETYYQLRERILGYYDRQMQWRAGLAAQFEPALAYESVKNAMALAQGMTHKTWNTMRDDGVCSFCRSNEAAGTIPIEQAFPSGDATPPNHPQCRCFTSWSMASEQT